MEWAYSGTSLCHPPPKAPYHREPGDAPGHARYQFHTGADVTAEGVAEYEASEKPLLRYTVRYMPSGARLSALANFEPSLKQNPELAGRPLEDAPEHYPLVFRRRM